MKGNTLMPRLITGRMRTWEEIPDPAPEANGVSMGRRFLPATDIRVRLIMSEFGIPKIYTSDLLQAGALLSDFRDQNGVLILGHSIYNVAGIQAVVNAFGFSDGYAFRLSTADLRDFDADPLEIMYL